ncbi:peptidylprolyl isomerase [Chengkuizengella axinellae]|uniref:Peptidylprolyl isomerase n=1 Tax=Chengkuizengella axinellae TaxID=3064388 RepID=A0ABT9J5R5_9BACL|nr:peptidylprolyl isomerase [Chengkuizengella sp. 2205SS18-9]MDP5276949.1 peptidylprolyl isomerase [Chengkuizengella sp. 2205SS18-9]
MQQGKLKWIKGFMMALSLVLVLTACGQEADEEGAADTGESGTENEVVEIGPTEDAGNVAEYEGGEVTVEEFNSFTGVMKLLYTPPYFDQLQATPGFNDNLVKQLVAFELLEAKADEETKKEQQEIAEGDLQTFIAEYEAANGEGSWSQGLEEVGIVEEDFRTFIVLSNVSQEVLSNQISDEEVQAEYNRVLSETPAQLVSQATVSHILIQTFDPATEEEIRSEEEAMAIVDEVYAKLDAGEDFGELAKEYSEDEGSKNNGGTYENANINNWVEEFKLAAAEQPVGEIGKPVKTVYGYHIIKVDDRTELSFDEVKDAILASLVQGKLQTYSTEEAVGLITGISVPEIAVPSEE